MISSTPPLSSGHFGLLTPVGAAIKSQEAAQAVAANMEGDLQFTAELNQRQRAAARKTEARDAALAKQAYEKSRAPSAQAPYSRLSATRQSPSNTILPFSDQQSVSDKDLSVGVHLALLFQATGLDQHLSAAAAA